jgi:hypothetical protein
MCTMHPENFIDQNMLTSTSLTERLKLWQKYAKKPVDTETVRLEFFRKVRSGKLFQKSRVKRSPLENRVKVRISARMQIDDLGGCHFLGFFTETLRCMSVTSFSQS